MTDDPMWNFILQRVKSAGYKSINFDLALVKEESWKILIARIIFDIAYPAGQSTLLKKPNFVIERFSLPLDEFQRFFEYLKRVDVTHSMHALNSKDYPAEEFFNIGIYKLNFKGNFPSKEVRFLGRQRAKNPRGIDKPIYYFEYNLQNFVIPHSYLNIDLSGHEIPLSGVFDAVNEYWSASFEQFHLSSAGCGIYMPTYDASITDCDFKQNHLKLKIDFDEGKIKINELSVGIIAGNTAKKYGKKHYLKETSLEIDVGLIPTYATIYLNKGEEKLDEYYPIFQSPVQLNALAISNDAEIKNSETKSRDIFLSHSNKQKELAGQLKRGLENSIKCEIFLAHDDLEGGEDWAEGIRNRIKNCGYFLVLLSEEYHNSKYTDQEAGIAYAYDKPIIPISIDGTIPYGFMSKYQPIKAPTLNKTTIHEIAKQIINKDIPMKERLDYYIQLLTNSYSFNNAIFLSDLLPYDYEYSKEQINKLARIMIQNDQVYGCVKARPRIVFILNKNKLFIDNDLYSKLSKFFD